MSYPSKDASTYVYDRSHELIHGTPHRRGLLTYVSHKPVHPSAFCITNAEHVCSAAYFGFLLMPSTEKSFKECVADSGAFTRTVKARIRDVEVRIEQINRLAFPMGFQIKYDRKVPLNMESFELMRPMLGDFIDLLPQFEKDLEYVTGGHAAKLNHFAHEYRQRDLSAMLAFIRELDAIAEEWGYGSFANLCVPTRFMDHMSKTHAEDPNMQGALAEMKAKRNQLKKESSHIIELFLKSHGHGDLSYFVDMRGEELFIEMRYPTHSVGEYSKSEFIGDDGTDRLLGMMDFLS